MDAEPHRSAPAPTTVAMLRAAYGAFAIGDVLRFLDYCADDFVFRVPGRNRMAGAYRGHGEFFRAVETLLELAGGTRAHEVLDVRATDGGGLVRLVHRVERDGATIEVPVTHVCAVRSGKLVEVEERPDDPAAYDAAWS